MKKIHLFAILLPVVLLAAFLTASCTKDRGAQEPPVIESVRITDPEKADSTFTQSLPGRMIVVQGKYLSHAQKVLINGQDITFNPNLNTDHSIIVKIPTEADGFQLSVWNPDLPQEIQVVTAAGSASFAFKVLAPVPSMERIAAKYPRREGTLITVYGFDFLDLTRVYFADMNPYAKEYEGGAVEVDVPRYELSLDRNYDEKERKYITDSQMSFSMPAISFTDGFLVLEAPQGHAVIDFAALPPTPLISGISSDMPVAGSVVEVRGDYFVALEGIKIGDAIAVPAAELTVSEDERSLTFVMPEKPAETTTLSVVTAGGESDPIPFCRHETVLVNFDGLGKDLNWSPNASYRTADGTAEPYVSDGKFACYDETLRNTWYGTMVYFQSATGSDFTLPGTDVIPADTPVSDVYLMFEVYNKYPFTHIFHYRWRTSDGKDHDWQNWANDRQIYPEFTGLMGEQRFGQWYTSALPLDRFADFKGLTYGELREKGLKRIRLMLHNHTQLEEQVFICVDNIRLSTLPTYGR